MTEGIRRQRTFHMPLEVVRGADDPMTGFVHHVEPVPEVAHVILVIIGDEVLIEMTSCGARAALWAHGVIDEVVNRLVDVVPLDTVIEVRCEFRRTT